MDIDVKHVAELARLSISQKELDILEKELKSILAHVEKLSEVDVEGVAPSFGCNFGAEGLEKVSDRDIPQPGLLRPIAFLAAPSRESAYYKVPRESKE